MYNWFGGGEDEDLQGILGRYFGQDAQEAAPIDPAMLQPDTSFIGRLSVSPLAQFGMGVLANNSGHYGYAGPALGQGFAAMTRAQEAQRRTGLQQAQLLAKYKTQMAREQAIDKLDIPSEQKTMLRADPALARKQIGQALGLDLPSPAMQDFLLRKAAAGKPSISVGGNTVMLAKEEESLGRELPGRILDEFKASRDKVAGSLSSWGTWQRVEDAVTRGGLTGPAAEQRLSLLQIGDMLGVTGASQQETMANTRRLIQGFAELALNARELLKGTGPITDFEQRTAQKAASGDYTDMSPIEIVTLARLNRRATLAQAMEHNRRIDEFSSRDPRYAEIGRLYRKEIPRHYWPTPTQKGIDELKARRNSPEYVDAWRRQFGPEWTQEVLGSP